MKVSEGLFGISLIQDLPRIIGEAVSEIDDGSVFDHDDEPF